MDIGKVVQVVDLVPMDVTQPVIEQVPTVSLIKETVSV